MFFSITKGNSVCVCVCVCVCVQWERAESKVVLKCQNLGNLDEVHGEFYNILHVFGKYQIMSTLRNIK
jgi:hypothetical protein